MNDFASQLSSFGSNAFTALRPAQLDVLEQYGNTFASSPDIGIELPTGAGKTLIALLIADFALDRGLRVSYLTGTRQLANQVITQAEGLPGLDVRQFYGKNYPAADLLAYNRAEALGIMNYWVYFNASPKVEPADLILFDDAHLAEQALAGMYTLRVGRESAEAASLYQAICNAIDQTAPGLYPLLPALRDGAVPRTVAPELISFFDWERALTVVHDLIDESELLKSDTSAFFAWRAIKSNLARCGVLVGPTAIEIRPYHIPTQTIPGYTKSRERVYLSATLGQVGDIQRRLGTRPVTTIRPKDSSPTGIPRLGRRTFLVNPGLEQSLEGNSWSFAMEQVEQAAKHPGGRVAWLCASTPEANEIEKRLTDLGSRVFRLKQGDDSAVERWQEVPFAHLVTAGRFDGLDFPDDVCRLVIVPSVPAASTEFERFVVAYLGDAAYMRYRVGQRVTQALGRANRTPGDAALYIGLDPALGADVREAVATGIQLHGGSWNAVREAAASFWTQVEDPKQQAVDADSAKVRRTRPGRQVGASAADSAPSEIAAVTRLWLGDSEGAATNAARAAELLDGSGELEHAAFWSYVEAHSYFVGRSGEDEGRARKALQTAVASAPQTAWFVRLQRTVHAMEGTAPGDSSLDSVFLAWDEWIRESGSRVLQVLATARQGLQGRMEEQNEALATLGRLCGLNVRRNASPRPSGSRWAWATAGTGHLRLLMARDGHSGRVERDDVNELLAIVLEEETLHPRSRVSGCLVTEATTLTEAAALAAASDRISFVEIGAAVALYDLMAERFTDYVSASGTGSARERGAARIALEHRLPAGNWLADLTGPRGVEFTTAIDVRNAFAAKR
ncbi:helicase C-terminal domain-containing protein [Salinibacterium sp. ZJ450]|uniref:DEAD/DEAH box helicase n=1 Tax=Salinibacterium sp. ZJ450 TaxID=2708338 RepID=UPI00141D85CC|nr:helicase C-terminal domain-containing protein [Salinibacterium sp. ZJ450]